MKKKYLLLITAALLLAFSAYGATIAATTPAGNAATNELSSPTLKVSLEQKASSQISADMPVGVVMPGDALKNTGFKIENTADTAFYVRVTVTKCWTDIRGFKNNTELTSSMIKMEEEKDFLQARAPFEGDSGETEVFYYAKPLLPGESVNFDLEITVSEEIGNEYQSAGILLEVTADAAQFVYGYGELNAGALLSVFGVKAELSDDGSITSLTQ